MWALTQKRPIWKLSFFSICTPRIWLQWKGWNSFWKNVFFFYMVAFSWDIVSLFLLTAKGQPALEISFFILFCTSFCRIHITQWIFLCGLLVICLPGHEHTLVWACVRFWQIVFSYFGSLELKGFSVLFMSISHRKCFMTIWLGLVHENWKMLLHILHHPIIQRPCIKASV